MVGYQNLSVSELFNGYPLIQTFRNGGPLVYVCGLPETTLYESARPTNNAIVLFVEEKKVAWSGNCRFQLYWLDGRVQL